MIIGYALESIRIGEDGKVILLVANAPKDAEPKPLIGAYTAETDVDVGELVAVTKDGTIIGKHKIDMIQMRKGDVLNVNWDYTQNKEADADDTISKISRVKGMVEKL